MSYTDIGDSVDDSCVVVMAVHTSCAPTVEPINLILPPKSTPKPIGAYIYEPLNCPQHSVCYGRNVDAFNSDEACQMQCVEPQKGETVIIHGVQPAYSLLRAGSPISTTAGAMVLLPSSL